MDKELWFLIVQKHCIHASGAYMIHRAPLSSQHETMGESVGSCILNGLVEFVMVRLFMADRSVWNPNLISPLSHHQGLGGKMRAGGVEITALLRRLRECRRPDQRG